MAAWIAPVISIGKTVIGTEAARRIIDKAVDLASKAIEERMSPKPNQTIEQLQSSIKRLEEIDVEQAKLIEDIANQLNAVRYVAVTSLFLSVGAVALVIVLHFLL